MRETGCVAQPAGAVDAAERSHWLWRFSLRFYTYLASTLITVTQVGETAVPVYLAVHGSWDDLRHADRRLGSRPGAETCRCFILFAINIGLMMPLSGDCGQRCGVCFLLVLAIGLANGFPILLQTRLMVGGRGCTGAGGFFAPFCVQRGQCAGGRLWRRFSSPAVWASRFSGYVGAALTFGGALVFAVTVWDYRRGWKGGY